jgi:membrane fusion protein (multidrug efflux system)
MTEMSKIEPSQAAQLSTPATPKPSPRARRLRQGLLVLALLATTAAAGQFGYDYWTNGRFEVATDDAYVQADYTAVAPKISGYIAEVLVAANRHVNAGQVLARIDDRDFRTALDQAHAGVAAARAAVGDIDAQLGLQQAQIRQAAAAVAASQASLDFAQADAQRYRALFADGAGSLQQAQQTQAARETLTANVARDQAGLAAAARKVDVLRAQRAQAEAEVQKAEAAERQAELNLGYTTITAPVEGTVGSRSLRVGQYVQAGTQLMAVVPLHAAYVVANYKETQLAHVRAGEPVASTVDGLPGARIKGHVDSIAPASGLEFALLPPDNATGNFTKIVQRIPVKIVLDDPAAAGVLRAGMSVEPSIDTRDWRAIEAATSSTHNG